MGIVDEADSVEGIAAARYPSGPDGWSETSTDGRTDAASNSPVDRAMLD